MFRQCAVLLWSFGSLFSQELTHEWMDIQINREFESFNEGISLEDINQAENQPGNLVRYKIINREVFGSEMVIKDELIDLCRRFPVPDVDFIYDYSEIVSNTFCPKIPIFGLAKIKGEKGVILFDENITRHFNWDSLVKETIEASIKNPWNTKINTLFWRGSASDGWYGIENWKNPPRGKLVYLSQLYPDLIDAGFFRINPWHSNTLEQTWQATGKKEPMPYDYILHFKYGIDLDGSTCSIPATMWKLFMNSVIFKHDSDLVMYFHEQLKPYVHYIPVKRDLSDLFEQLAWAEEHDEEARKIAENAQQFALTNLTTESRRLYFYKVLVKYATLQKFTPIAN
ncbi:MAG TPA: glycosyl transferase family 90 [Chlamydiales bacterium]|nr:glycosyl transferase family 90 [Chlamydiales bacterium]